MDGYCGWMDTVDGWILWMNGYCGWILWMNGYCRWIDRERDFPVNYTACLKIKNK